MGYKMKKVKTTKFMGEEIDKKNFPIMYGKVERSPEEMRRLVKSLSKDGNVSQAIINLESDLQHG